MKIKKTHITIALLLLLWILISGFNSWLKYEDLSFVQKINILKLSLLDKELRKELLHCPRYNPNLVISLIEKGANPNLMAKCDTPLNCAVINNDIYSVELLLKKGANINKQGEDKNTPLINATKKLDIEIIKTLLDKGADPNAVGSYGTTPLMEIKYNLYGKDYEKQLKAAQLLIDYGANVKAVNKSGDTALQTLCWDDNVKLTKLLIDNKINVNTGKPSPLRCALERSNLKIAKVLIKNGANIKEKNLLSSLLWGANLHSKSDLYDDQYQLAKMLLERGALFENDLLFEAVKSGNPKIVKLLIDHGAEVNTKDKYGNTPLMFINTNLLTDNKLEIPKILLDNGADINAINNKKYNVLIQLINLNKDCQLDIFEYLVSKGANYKYTNNGNSVLTYAIHEGNHKIANYLISKGALKNNSNNLCTYEFIKLSSSNEIEMGNKLIDLIKNGANYKCQDKNGNNLLQQSVQGKNLQLTNYLIEKGLNVNHKNNSDETALMLAKEPTQAELLIQNGADIEARDNKGQTPLMHVVLSYKPNTKLADKLIELGANINAKDNTGKTVIMKAHSSWTYLFKDEKFINCSIYQYLINKGADINAKDNNGNSVNYWVKKNDCNLDGIQKSPDLYSLKESKFEIDRQNIIEARKGIDKNTEIHYVGVLYNSVTASIDLKITLKNKPIVLFLGDSGKITWNISMDKGVILKKVIINNRDKVIFKNKNSNTIISQLTKNNSRCGCYYGDSLYSYIDNITYIKDITGKEPKTYQGARSKKSFIIDGIKNEHHSELESKNVFLICNHSNCNNKLSIRSEACAISSRSYNKGKWYFEAKLNEPQNNHKRNDFTVGMIIDNLDGNCYSYDNTYEVFDQFDRTKAIKGDIYGIALDLDNHKIYFSKNGLWSNSIPNKNIGGTKIQDLKTYKVWVTTRGPNTFSGYPASWELNFGATPFKYKPPSNFKAYNEGK